MKIVSSGRISTTNSSTLPSGVSAAGELVSTDGINTYRLYQVEDANVAANDVVEYSDATGLEVTADRAGGSSLGKTAAGVAATTVTDGNYGYFQVSGTATVKVPAATAVAAGNLLVPHVSSDGAVEVATTSTFKHAFAVALAADTATTSAAGTVACKLIRV